MAEIKALYYFPIKGLSETALETAQIMKTGVAHDRALAFAFKDSIQPENASAPLDEFPWTTKFRLAVQMDWPGLSALKVSVSDQEILTIGLNKKEFRFSLKSLDDRNKAGKFMSDYLKTISPQPAAKHSEATEVSLVGSYHSTTRYPDRVKEHVSILNLSSLRELEFAMGVKVDIRRFRGNIIVDDPTPWNEASWTGKILSIGEVEIECSALIGRCFNINVHPDHGVADLDVLTPLKDLCNQRIGRNLPLFGIMGKVVKTGQIHVRDSLAVLN